MSSACLTDVLVHRRYALGMKDLFVALLSRDLLLLKRHSFVYVFRTIQVCWTAKISTLYCCMPSYAPCIDPRHKLACLAYSVDFRHEHSLSLHMSCSACKMAAASSCPAGPTFSLLHASVLT